MKFGKAIALLGASLILGFPSANAAYADASPTITVNPLSGPPNTEVAITGHGFPANELIEIYLDSPNVHLGFPGPKSDAQGNFQENDIIPGTNPGRHMICADTNYPAPQAVTAKACTAFTVTALPASTTRPADSNLNKTGLPLPIVTFAIGVLVGIAIGAGLWRRHA